MSAPILAGPNCCGASATRTRPRTSTWPTTTRSAADRGCWAALMPNCNIQTADSNSLLVNKNASAGTRPVRLHGHRLHGRVAARVRLIGAYSDDDNYFYVEGANAADSAANAVHLHRLVQRLAGVETVIGKRLMFTSPGEVTGSLGISGGPTASAPRACAPASPSAVGRSTAAILGPGSLRGSARGRSPGPPSSTASVWEGPLALAIQQHLQPLHRLSRMHAVQPGGWFHLRRVDVYVVGARHVVDMVWGPSADFSPVAGTYVVQRVNDYPPPIAVRQGLRGPRLGACFWRYCSTQPFRLPTRPIRPSRSWVFGHQLERSERRAYTVSVVLGVTLELSWPGWSAFPPYGLPRAPGAGPE